MKKEYMTPAMEAFTIESKTMLLSGSGVSGDNGIGFGGVDVGGSLDPGAPELSILPEDLSGLPTF